jgi:hypothetical protein
MSKPKRWFGAKKEEKLGSVNPLGKKKTQEHKCEGCKSKKEQIIGRLEVAED